MKGMSSRNISEHLPAMQPRSKKGQQCDDIQPEHLLVLVHGILSSPADWEYVQKALQRRLGNKFLIHASAVNSFLNTLGGIDHAGRRLASEIERIVEKVPSLKRISFLAHSLGGLFARYAVAMLYTSKDDITEDMSTLEDFESRGEEHPVLRLRREPKIAGLEAVNYITLASPHLGVRGKKQLPFLLGVQVLEKLAAPIAPFVVGRTGRQLFLTDGKASDPPLLLRMASDCSEGLFISALRAFKSRVVYANVSYDHMVGWRTSSIRRESELSKPPRVSMDGYKHVVNVAYYPAVNSDAPSFQQESAQGKAAAQASPSSKKADAYHDTLEEEMVRGLQQVSWRKVDVSFHSALWPFLAHNSITVKDRWIHYEGTGVIAHVVDAFAQQEQNVFLVASL
ncbi:lipid droplet phospholipase 1 isoform X2 [Physcomitrium patens]|uniref:DUF676 domain-containing protein n=2 Tax=Physcomitrium patens TaxID=3218 RepID=A0A2K1L9L1_PHYPA|nr:uncharacterized protein LOC112284988 isoform X2 [Physcomitrium patens]XP_024381201.1 uncharacterized protein LOC112284988 isoform X2 [Physcomitrium patens]XP_024381210.1 uncharacterized protein LOC112284988 isoform X2 [Physcomitrium patens]XP_024381219.1 uncharacterized protein LOC112284988 isoform X2 [Physcomitrium patens]XP_024381228.1 uncharacterized protein LOC112284988 isoform X2 [Physcomitrium patens]PNR62719.1 hypothetical protein PHYPA_001143 [Physcomitrium patens]|eukprot:XP_024381193.1 uncharacterized protein LOC112284988 isoform X2 [Physcomitrella patens]